MFDELQQRYPNQFPSIQLRTLERRVREWRGEMIMEFDDQWVREDLNNATSLPKPLRGVRVSEESGGIFPT
jgi:hypothetical protein